MAFLDSAAFPPNAGVDVTPNPNPDQQKEIAGQWREFLGDQANRAALLQFGLAMMQPVGLGQTPLGHAGQAIGQAGEAQDRVIASENVEREAQRKERETDSRAELRTAQATRAEAGATAAGARAETARMGAEVARERLDTTRTLGRFQRQISASNAYRQYVDGEAKQRLLEPNRPPPMDRTSWYAAHGFGDLLQETAGTPALGPEPTGPAAGAPPAAYPDARRAPDGNWYVQKDGKYYRVQQ